MSYASQSFFSVSTNKQISLPCAICVACDYCITVTLCRSAEVKPAQQEDTWQLLLSPWLSQISASVSQSVSVKLIVTRDWPSLKLIRKYSNAWKLVSGWRWWRLHFWWNKFIISAEQVSYNAEPSWGMPMNLGHFTSFPSIFILHSSLCSAFFLSVSLSILLPYLRHMAELWTVEQGARPAQN